MIGEGVMLQMRGKVVVWNDQQWNVSIIVGDFFKIVVVLVLVIIIVLVLVIVVVVVLVLMIVIVNVIRD